MSYKDIIMPILAQRKNKLEGVIKKAQKAISSPVEGYLEVNRNRGHYRYYYRDANKNSNKKIKRQYLRDLNLAKQIANRDYSRQVFQSANRELKQINALLNAYQNSTAEECFQKLHPGRQILTAPLLQDDEQYAELWMTKSQASYNSYPMNFPIQTENHEMVRSKSEKIIADKLKLLGVPYVYEKPLRLGKILKYPDFTALNKRTRGEFYWEHLGLMDQPEYFRDAMKKLEVYYQNQIWPGKNLIITFETTNQPLDVEMIEQIIHTYLI